MMRGNGDPPKLQAQEISVSFGGLRALQRVTVDVFDGEIAAIIGPNGAGKTTLLNAISGVYHPVHGRILRGMSVLDNIMVGRHCHMHAGLLSAGFFWGPAQREEIRHRAAVERIIDFLEINHLRKASAGTLPYGLQKRVELGRALAAEPKLLLLDEPMAGMNLEEKEDMARFILDVNDEWGTTMILIEHDMGVVMDISDRVMVLDHGEKIAEGQPDQVRSNAVVVRAYLGETAEGEPGG